MEVSRISAVRKQQKQAKKEHVCAVCTRKIWPGQEYINVRFKDPFGIHHEEKRHIHCHAAIEAYRFHSGDLPDENRENEISRIKTWARDNVCSQACSLTPEEMETCISSGAASVFECEKFHEAIQPRNLITAVSDDIMQTEFRNYRRF